MKEEHLRASLLSAVEHKIRQKLLEVFAQAQVGHYYWHNVG